MIARKYTCLFGFSGAGPGALGTMRARVKLLDMEAEFESWGGIDFDPIACRSFEYLTKTPAWCMDIKTLTGAMLRERYGAIGPDFVFGSPPCQGASRLLSTAKSKTQKYTDLNELTEIWIDALMDAWGDTSPPKLVLIENVPGLPTRAAGMLRRVRARLRKHGYVFHASTHDCGEIGGLAQHRQRYLLVARHAPSCAPLLYQPPKKRVRGVGEVLGELPMPATVAARAWGSLHLMPKLSWRNWLRLALIPAGGDWRDLDGVLEGRARREVFRRHAVQAWEQPIDAVTGPGGHSVEAVSDPRVGEIGATWNNGAYGVKRWEDAAGTITAGGHPSKGVFSVADPRVEVSGNANLHHSKHAVIGWDDASPTVIGQPQPSSGMAAVADPRVDAIRVPVGYDAAYGVLGWDEPARTVAGNSAAGCGAYAVADPRSRELVEDVRVLTLDEAMALDLDPKRPPPFTPLIVSEDGTWHRPMTLLELAALQGIPSMVDGAPLRLEGTRTQIATHIGNAVPVGAGEAIGMRVLSTLAGNDASSWSMESGSVWVLPEERTVQA